MILDIPRFKCFIDVKYLTDGKSSGFVEGYCFSVTLLESRPLLFTVHTIHGAVYSRIPIQAIYHQIPENTLNLLESKKLDPWGAISSEGQAICHQYLKDYETLYLKEDIKGVYKFTIDYFNGGFAQDPEQHKTSNVLFLDNGQIAAIPNNFCLFLDGHFTTSVVDLPYKRNTQYYYIGDSKD